MESYRPGIDLAEMLARHPNRVEELTAAALSAIAPLHRRTATFVVVDNVCLLRRWVIEPLAGLTDMCQRLDPGLVPEVDRLGTMLRQTLVGRRMPVSWTHGDYTPGNVRVAGVQGPVTGIVDWGGARPGQPALIDEYLMILMASCQVERADLGTVVTERLRAGGLSDRERHALRAARDRADADIGDRERIDERIDERVAILLTWLHHVADLWRKCATHPNQHIWFATNVAPVLDAVAAWPGFDVSSARPATRRRKRCTDDHVSARRGCRTGPGKSGQWLTMHNGQRMLTETPIMFDRRAGPDARVPDRRTDGAGGDQSLRQIGTYIREATDPPPRGCLYRPRPRDLAAAPSPIPPQTGCRRPQIHRRTGDS